MTSAGIGMWQTVSTREVDEEEQLLEHVRSDQARNDMLSSAADNESNDISGNHRSGKAVPSSSRHHDPLIGDREEDNHSALSAFDPYGRHLQVYRGIKLFEDATRKEQVGTH